MTPALLLVDLQRDYLDRPGFEAPARALLARVARLLDAARSLGVPVLHVHTRVLADGSDRMPHQRRRDVRCCVAGTSGAEAAPAAAPRAGEAVFYKRVFDAFSEPALLDHLSAIGCDTLIVAGVHLHACVRQAAIGAYERGFEVIVADDAVASYDPLHAEVTRAYLAARDISFVETDALVDRLGDVQAWPGRAAVPQEAGVCAFVGGRWRTSTATMRWERRNPARWDERLGMVAEATEAQLDAAVEEASRAQRAWAAQPPAARAQKLERLADALERRGEQFARVLVREVGKPLADARRECTRAVELVRSAVTHFGDPRPWLRCGDGVHARRAPLGVVAAITPFNHPLGIVIGKLAPALALGNTVVRKPALAAADSARLLLEALAESGLPDGSVGVVLGDGSTAQRLARHAQVAGVTVTASIEAGRQLALICGAALKPIQAELGGNNAAVVMADADPERIAPELARSAFSYAGQRCTAVRRILIDSQQFDAMRNALVAAAGALRVGEPGRDDTEVGPLVSRAHRDAVAAKVEAALRAGARLECGGGVPRELDHGCWYAPTVLSGVAPDSALFREETFGPVVLLQPIDDLEHGLRLVNAVEHGLVATLYSEDPAAQRRFLAAAEAGVVKLNCSPAGVHAEAPFGGWKSSGLGPPEHGAWDEEFYSRAQAVYGFAEDDGSG